MISQQPCPTLSTSRLASAVRSPFAANLLARAQTIAQERCLSLQQASRSLAEQFRTLGAAPTVGPLTASQGWHTLAALVRPDAGATARSTLFNRGTRALLSGCNTDGPACLAVRAPPETSVEAPPPTAASGQQPAGPAPSSPSTPLFASVQWLFVQQLDTLMKKGRADSDDYMSADMRVRRRVE